MKLTKVYLFKWYSWGDGDGEYKKGEYICDVDMIINHVQKENLPLKSEEHIFCEQILNSAVLIPNEKSWYDVKQSAVLENVYPNGVIIL
jgi:hypothetical protein